MAEYDPVSGLSYDAKERDDDKGQMVVFYPRAKHMKRASEEAGHAVYENLVYIKIESPGNRFSLVDREATDADKHRFSDRWRKFLENAEQVQEGTPLEMWPILTPAEVATYKAANVHTVEALCAVPDGLLYQLGLGARERRDKAQKWLAQATSDKPLMTALERIKDLEGEKAVNEAAIAALRDQVRELAEKMDKQ